MLTCEQVTALLLDYSLGELDDETSQQVAAHQGHCPRCAAFAHTYAAVPQMVHAALQVDVDEVLQAELDAAVMQALQRAQ